MYIEWKVPIKVKNERLVAGLSHAFGPFGTAVSCCGIRAYSPNAIAENDAQRTLAYPPRRCKKCIKITEQEG